MPVVERFKLGRAELSGFATHVELPMIDTVEGSSREAHRAHWASTVAFTACFAA